MLEVVERLARERADLLQRESTALTEEPDGFLVFASENCRYVALLSQIWQALRAGLRNGGMPAKFFLRDCDVMRTFLTVPENFLRHVVRVWHQRELPAEVADSVYANVHSAQSQLQTLSLEVQSFRDEFSNPKPIAAEPNEIKQLVKRADEGREWLPMRDAIAQLREACTPKKE